MHFQIALTSEHMAGWVPFSELGGSWRKNKRKNCSKT